MKISKIKIKKKWYNKKDKVLNLEANAALAWNLDFKGLRNANS